MELGISALAFIRSATRRRCICSFVILKSSIAFLIAVLALAPSTEQWVKVFGLEVWRRIVELSAKVGDGMRD
jgi:hypothetical protein